MRSNCMSLAPSLDLGSEGWPLADMLAVMFTTSCPQTVLLLLNSVKMKLPLLSVPRLIHHCNPMTSDSLHCVKVIKFNPVAFWLSKHRILKFWIFMWPNSLNTTLMWSWHQCDNELPRVWMQADVNLVVLWPKSW